MCQQESTGRGRASARPGHRRDGLGRRAAIAAGVIAVIGSGAAADPVLLDAEGMDRITAGGLSVIADSSSFAHAPSNPALSDTVTLSEVSPDGGITIGESIAVGTEGAFGEALSLISVTDDGLAEGGEAFAAAATPGTEPVIAATAGAVDTGGGTTLAVTAFADGAEAVTGTLAEGQIAGPTGAAAGVTQSDNLSTDGGPSLSESGIVAGTDGFDMAAGSAGIADDVSISATGTAGVLEVAAGPVGADATAEAIATGTGSQTLAITFQLSETMPVMTRVLVLGFAAADGADGAAGSAVTGIDTSGLAPGTMVLSGGTDSLLGGAALSVSTSIILSPGIMP